MPITLTPKVSPARLPVLLAALLVPPVVLQLATPVRIELPPIAGAALDDGNPQAADPPPVFVPGALVAGNLFAPVTRPSTAASAAPPDPLGGAVIVGVVQHGTQRLALIQGPGAALHYVASGGSVAGWRLVTLGPADALLRRGRDHLDLAYGAHSVAPAAPQSADKTP